MPAVGLTDHGSLGRRGRALPRDGQARRQAADRLRGLRLRRPARADEGVRASDTPGRVERGLRQPDQARVGGLPRGLLLQAARRLGVARDPREGPRRPLGLPLRARLQGARGEPRQGRAGRARPDRADLRPRQRLRRDAERRPRRAGADQPVPRRARARVEAAARRDRRRPLPPARGCAGPRGAPLRPVRRLAQEPEPLEVRHRPVLLQDPGRDGRRLRRLPRRARPHARGRRAPERRHRARRSAPAEVPGAGRARGLRLPRRAVREGAREALRQAHARALRAAAVRAQDHPRDGLRRLLPDRLGLHRLREAKRDQRRPRARQRRRLARRLLPRDHRRRPDPLRPAVRALPQPGPQVHARHGHRLRRRGARPRHQLRRREVRPRPRRADHHLLDHDGPRGRARRGPGARHPVRDGRQGREADPGRPEGLPRRLPQAEWRAAQGLRLRPGREGDRRPGEAARGPRARRLDPCGRGRDRRPAADRVRPAAAEGRRPGGRHPVPDGRRRGARPAQDGLPRTAQPRRDRQGGRARRRPRHRAPAARRQEDLRDARARGVGGRLPVRVLGHARGAQAGQAHRVRRPDRARRPLPARGRWPTSPSTPSARPAARR